MNQTHHTISSHFHQQFPKTRIIKPNKEGQTALKIQGNPPKKYHALIQDSPKLSNNIVTNAVFNIGDWIEIQSKHIFTDNPNSKKAHLSCIRQIVDKSGDNPYHYQLNSFLHDAYIIDDMACVGKVDIVENVTLENIILNNHENFMFKFGLYIKYAANITLINPIIDTMKKPFSSDKIGQSAIKLAHCFNVQIFNPIFKHIGWYGVEMTNAAENIYIEGGKGLDCRHTISVNWNETKGRPNNITVYNMTALNNTLSSFDTHDIGNHIVFDSCKSFEAGDDGFQFRTPRVIARNCLANNSFLDGFSTQEGADYCIFENCTGQNNNRNLFQIHQSKHNLIL